MEQKENNKIDYEKIKISSCDLDNDYFNFELNDIRLAKIEKGFQSKISNEQLNTLKNQFNAFIKFLKNNITQLSYPYLKNAYEIIFKDVKDDLLCKYLILLIIGHKNEITEIVCNFYSNLISSKNFDISEVKSAIKSEIYISNEFKTFTICLSNWHAHSELVILYLWFINYYESTEFVFEKEKFSYQTNLKTSYLIFAKKNLFKLTSSIVSQLTLNLKIDKEKIESVVFNFFTVGMNLSNLLAAFPVQKIMTTLGIYGFNFVINKIAQKVNYKSNMLELQKFQKIIEKLNKNLNKLIDHEETLLKIQLKKEILNDSDQGMIMSIEEATKSIKSTIDKYLKNINLDEKQEKHFGEHMNEMLKYYESNLVENDWLMISFKKS